MIKLSVELVPQTSWGNNVRSAFSKSAWEDIRKFVLLEAGYICSICGEKNSPLECHEIWEYDDINHIQKLVGLAALCQNCHHAKHLGRSKIIGVYDKTIKHIMKVNRWTYAEAKQYDMSVFSEWMKRSQFNWTVDLSELDHYLEKVGRTKNGDKKKERKGKRKI